MLPYSQTHFSKRLNSELVKDDATTVKKDCMFKGLKSGSVTVYIALEPYPAGSINEGTFIQNFLKPGKLGPETSVPPYFKEQGSLFFPLKKTSSISC